MIFELGKIGGAIADNDALKQRLVCLLSTSKFSIPFNWNFGIDYDAPDLEQEVREAIALYFPNLTIPNLEIEGKTLKVYLTNGEVIVSDRPRS